MLIKLGVHYEITLRVTIIFSAMVVRTLQITNINRSDVWKLSSFSRNLGLLRSRFSLLERGDFIRSLSLSLFSCYFHGRSRRIVISFFALIFFFNRFSSETCCRPSIIKSFDIIQTYSKENSQEILILISSIYE